MAQEPYKGEHPVAYNQRSEKYHEFPDATRIGAFAITPSLSEYDGRIVLTHQPSGCSVGVSNSSQRLEDYARRLMEMDVPWGQFATADQFTAWSEANPEMHKALALLDAPPPKGVPEMNAYMIQDDDGSEVVVAGSMADALRQWIALVRIEAPEYSEDSIHGVTLVGNVANWRAGTVTVKEKGEVEG